MLKCWGLGLQHRNLVGGVTTQSVIFIQLFQHTFGLNFNICCHSFYIQSSVLLSYSFLFISSLFMESLSFHLSENNIYIYSYIHPSLVFASSEIISCQHFSSNIQVPLIAHSHLRGAIEDTKKLIRNCENRKDSTVNFAAG